MSQRDYGREKIGQIERDKPADVRVKGANRSLLCLKSECQAEG